MSVGAQIIRGEILVIDDEAAIRRLLRLSLEGSGYAVNEADCGTAGLLAAATRPPDLIILDLGLPDMEGHEVIKRLREWCHAPILVLSVRQEVQDKVQALDLGADDYLTKPFHPDELAARLRVLRRHSPAEPDVTLFSSGPLSIDFVARQVSVAGVEVHLTATEYALLRILARYAGRVVTHRVLLREVWGPKAEEQSQYLRVYMTHLRKKLDPAAAKEQRLIQTEAGIGYRLHSG